MGDALDYYYDINEIIDNSTDDIPIEEYFKCPTFFFNSEDAKDNFFENILYALTVPSLIIFGILALLHRTEKHPLRIPMYVTAFFGLAGNLKSACLRPIYLFEEQTNRATYVASFLLVAWALVDAIMGDSPFVSWEYPVYLKGVVLLLTCLILSIIFYPIFGGVAAQHPISLALASVYAWLWTVVFLIMEGPCRTFEGVKDWALYGIVTTPGLLVSVYLCIALPYRTLRDNGQNFQVLHVKQLFEKPKFNEKLLTNLKKKTVVPGFRFGLTILVAVWVSVYMIFETAVVFAFNWYGLMEVTMAYIHNMNFLEQLRETYPSIKNATNDISDFTNELIFWIDKVQGLVLLAIAIACITTISSLLCTFANYRTQLLYLYKGVYKRIPRYNHKKTPRSIVVNSAKYIGYQMGYAAWAFIIECFVFSLFLFIIFIFAVLIFRYEIKELQDWLLLKAIPPLVYLIALLIIQNVLVHFFFLLRDSKGKQVLAIDNRRAFFNFQYFMAFGNAPLGLLSCLIRISKAIVFGVWALPRLDISTMSRSFEKFDNGFSAYVSLLSIENAQTNPVVVVFANLLTEQINSKDKSQNTRRKQILNRWHLIYTLLNNPSVRLQRKTKKEQQTCMNGDIKSFCNHVIVPIDTILVAAGFSIKVNLDYLGGAFSGASDRPVRRER